MAVRSGAGTGIIVSLVIFVVLTVALGALTIVFYAGQADAVAAKAQAEATMERYAAAAQRGTDRFKGFESDASQAKKSVSGYLLGRRDQLMRYASGDGSMSLAELQAELDHLGIESDGVVKSGVQDLRRSITGRDRELSSLDTTVEEKQQALAEKTALINQMRVDQSRELEQVSAQIDEYRRSGRALLDQVRDTVDNVVDDISDLEEDHSDQVNSLQGRVSAARRDLGVLRDRVDEYERVVEEIRSRSFGDPRSLVDGTVTDVDATRDEVLINRGRTDRIVLGTVFEVYDDPTDIRVNRGNGALPRGRATIRVVDIQESSSLCKIIRGASGQPLSAATSSPTRSTIRPTDTSSSFTGSLTSTATATRPTPRVTRCEASFSIGAARSSMAWTSRVISTSSCSAPCRRCPRHRVRRRPTRRGPSTPADARPVISTTGCSARRATLRSRC